MRLSLRTLLAFEDNVFAVEQHRQLEQIIPMQNTAAETLNRIRSAVRNPRLGAPGLIDGQEELDANFTAEYLDHQMPPELQDRFEAYCLSGDKYIAEVASVHQILSNVLGEPARTSRECRLRCYEARNLTGGTIQNVNEKKGGGIVFRAEEEKEHAAVIPLPPIKTNTALEQKESADDGDSFFNWFKGFFSSADKISAKNGAIAACLLAGFICGIIYCINGYEKTGGEQRTADSEQQTPVPAALENTVAVSESFADAVPVPIHTSTGETSGEWRTAARGPQAEVVPAEVKVDSRMGDPFLEQTLPPKEAEVNELKKADVTNPDSVGGTENKKLPMPTQVTFQPAVKPEEKRDDNAGRREVLPQTAWKDNNEQAVKKSVRPEKELLKTLPVILQTSGTVPDETRKDKKAGVNESQEAGVIPPASLGRLTAVPALVFSAVTPESPWILSPMPMDLKDGTYLLTAVPFRGTLELVSGYRIEMAGDSKICILPPDKNGTAGIFVDYGRIVIRPLQAGVPLRIETEKSQATVSVNGTKSVLFIDTFAEVVRADNMQKTAEPRQQGGGAKTAPILGFVPDNNESLNYKSAKMQNPFSASNRGSLLLQADGYSFAEIQRVPNWLQAVPQTPDEKRLADDVRRIFAEVQGNSEAALNRLIRDKSLDLRALGFRLWGDLGRFDVPLAVSAAKRPEDESVRQMLTAYFNEVMKRDSETILRFSAAIQSVKKGN